MVPFSQIAFSPLILLTVLEALILAIGTAQVLRLALKPAARRELATLPAVPRAAALVTVAVALGGVCWWLVTRAWALHIAALIALVLVIAAWVRARPAYGVRRGWPPGSLGIGASLDAISDRTFYLDRARAHGPVFKMSQFGRPVICVVGLGRGRALLQGQPNAVAGAMLPYNRFLSRGALRFMSAATHQQEGPLFRKAFGAIDLDASETAIRHACRAVLSDLVVTSRATAKGACARQTFERLLLAAMGRLFFGLDLHDARLTQMAGAMERMQYERIGGRQWRRRFDDAFVRMTQVLQSIASEASAAGRPVAPGTAFGALLDGDPSVLADVARTRNLLLTFRMTHGDMTGLLDWLFYMLSTNPEWQERVAQTPRVAGGPSVAQPADVASRVVLETLRMEQSEYFYRRVVQPLEVDGYRVPAGWLLRVCVQESHRDPLTFPDPGRFDPDRFAVRVFDPSEYSPFRADARGCMGAHLALYLGRVFVEELCHGYRWRVVRGGPVERGTRHRHHWRPSAATRVVLESLGGPA